MDWFHGVGRKAIGAVPWLCEVANGNMPTAFGIRGREVTEENRKNAIDLLGTIGGPRAIDTLIDLLADSSQRGPAKRALFVIGEKAVPALASALTPLDHSSAHEQAFSILQEMSPRPTQALTKAAEKTLFIKSQLMLLELLPTAFVVAQLGHRHWRIRQRAAELLGNKRHKFDDASRRKVRKTLDDNDIVVRTRIASLLRKRPDKNAEDKLLEWFKWQPKETYSYWSHELPTFYCHVADALAAMASTRGLKAIQLSFPRDPLRACPKALARYKNKQALSALRRAVTNIPEQPPNPQRYERTIEALGQVGFKEARPDLERLLSHSNHRIRWASIRALSALGDTNAIGALRNLTNDNNSEVRRAANRTIKQLNVNLTRRPRSTR